MELNLTGDRSIFLQVSDEIEDAIFTGAFQEETQIPSTTEISMTFHINPATVLKGMNLLVDEGIIYKKRGVGMFVAKGAAKKVKIKRQKLFYSNYIETLIKEAEKLGITKEELISLIEEGMKNEQD